MGQVAFEETPHARLERPVAILPVALPQAAEDAENTSVALGREGPIGPLEALVGAGAIDLTFDHRVLEVGRHIAPRVF